MLEPQPEPGNRHVTTAILRVGHFILQLSGQLPI